MKKDFFFFFLHVTMCFFVFKIKMCQHVRDVVLWNHLLSEHQGFLYRKKDNAK